ncbi:MAG: heavy metal-associated domain-containing protein [Cyclonatronaceae bacterium]
MEKKEIFRIEGMKCSGCSEAVQSALRQSDGVSEAKVSHEDGTAQVTHSLSDDDIARIVENAGYHVAGRSR